MGEMHMSGVLHTERNTTWVATRHHHIGKWHLFARPDTHLAISDNDQDMVPPATLDNVLHSFVDGRGKGGWPTQLDPADQGIVSMQDVVEGVYWAAIGIETQQPLVARADVTCNGRPPLCRCCHQTAIACSQSGHALLVAKLVKGWAGWNIGLWP
jgi:hypothetical protein